jgi:hypothetical protein
MLLIIYVVLGLTGINAIMFFGALDRNLRTRNLIKAYGEDVRSRGGRLPLYVKSIIKSNVKQMPTGISRKIKLLQKHFRGNK